MKDNMHYIFLIGPFVGTLLILGGFLWRKKILKKYQSFCSTIGKVISLESQRGGTGFDTSNLTVYYPVIEFSVNGELYTTEGSIASSKPKYSKGSKVKILYNQNDPNNAIIKKEIAIIPKALIMIGCVFIFLGSTAFISISLTPNL